MRISPRWQTVARQCLFGAALLLSAASSGLADVRIRSSPGGEVFSYLRFFDAVRASGERVIIDGPCFSACTLVLSVVPNNRICMTRRAVLGFHAAAAIDNRGNRYSVPEATQVIAETYPPAVREWIRLHGGLSRQLIFLSGRELAGMFPTCR